MEGLKLLEEARSVGLSVRVEGGELIIRGPRSADAVAHRLLANKAEVVACFNGTGNESDSDMELLAWAAALSERDLELPNPIKYVEAPLRVLRTTRVSYYAALYLRDVLHSRFRWENPSFCWHPWTPQWWTGREREAMNALAAMRRALHEDDRSNSSKDSERSAPS